MNKVYVATDSDKIKETLESFRFGDEAEQFTKMEIIGRSAESAADTATTEFAMLEFAEKYEFDNIALVQATSPLLSSNDLDRGFESFNEVGTDSVLSVVRQKRFHWANNDQGFAYPTNYDVFHRPRRQEFKGYFVENGAFYITSKVNLVKSQNRISGNIKIVEMKEDTFFEIDEPSDWVIIEALMRKNGITSLNENDYDNIPKIKMLLTDCDGCLTDGGMYYSEKGDELKKFNTRDGMGFQLLHKKGIITGIITGEDVELNRRRADKLKVNELISGCKDKAKAIQNLCDKYKLSPQNVCYIGDDMNDIEAIQIVGYACCPADAVRDVKMAVDYITDVKGGEGVIREVVERICNS